MGGSISTETYKRDIKVYNYTNHTIKFTIKGKYHDDGNYSTDARYKGEKEKKLSPMNSWREYVKASINSSGSFKGFYVELQDLESPTIPRGTIFIFQLNDGSFLMRGIKEYYGTDLNTIIPDLNTRSSISVKNNKVVLNNITSEGTFSV